MSVKEEDIPYDLHNLLEIVGSDKFLEICKMYGGTLVYIPVYWRVILGERNRHIIKEYNGKNLKDLRLKYKISTTQLRHLLKDYDK